MSEVDGTVSCWVSVSCASCDTDGLPCVLAILVDMVCVEASTCF